MNFAVGSLDHARQNTWYRDRSRFALSNLILIDAPGDADAPADAGAPPSPVRPKTIQGVRIFAAGKACAYFFRIQKGEKGRADLPVQYQVELLRRGKTIWHQDWQPAASPQKDSKGMSFTGQVNLEGLTSGIYELRIMVKELQSKTTYQRAAIFGIE